MTNLGATYTLPTETPTSSTLDPSEWQFSSADNDLLIAVAGAVFGFPIFVIILICMLRIRMYYVEKRVRQNALLTEGMAMCSRHATTSGASLSGRSDGNSTCHEPSTSASDHHRLAKFDHFDSVEEHAGTSSTSRIHAKTTAISNNSSKGSGCEHKNKSKKHISIPNGDTVAAVVEIDEILNIHPEDNETFEVCETVIDVPTSETQNNG